MSNKELALSRKTAGAALKTAKFLATVEGLDALNEDEFSTAKDSTRPPPMHYFDHITMLLVNRLRSLSQLCPTTALRRYLSFAPVASLIACQVEYGWRLSYEGDEHAVLEHSFSAQVKEGTEWGRSADGETFGKCYVEGHDYDSDY